MATHDYVIANQSAPNARADLNNLFGAIVTNNSSASEPSTTYANMWWYDTTNNRLYFRNEADNAWILLATLDQSANTLDSEITFATQAEAEAGTDTGKAMTAQRVRQAIDHNKQTAHLAGGSYAILVNQTTSAITAGPTTAGSNLAYGVTLSHATMGLVTTGAAAAASAVGGTDAPGTWRCMGSSVAAFHSVSDSEGVATNTWSAGLFQRTA